MILNKTNCKIIEKLYNTPYIEEWKGKKVTILSTEVSAFGDVVDALRVKPIVPKSKPILNDKSPKWGDAKKAVKEQGATLESIRKHYQISDNDFKKLQA